MKNKSKFKLWWQMFDQIPLEMLIKPNIKISYKSYWQNNSRICEKNDNWLLINQLLKISKTSIFRFFMQWVTFLKIKTFLHWPISQERTIKDHVKYIYFLKAQ